MIHVPRSFEIIAAVAASTTLVVDAVKSVRGSWRLSDPLVQRIAQGEPKWQVRSILLTLDAFVVLAYAVALAALWRAVL